MRTSDRVSLLSILEPWPIAASFAAQSNAADLIHLSRVDSRIRAALHSFAPPADVSGQRVRQSLNIGSHQTSYWQQLKLKAPFTCSSPTHTRGSRPHPCRICSMPICEACVIRDSFARRSENTFKNRQRFLCKTCWTTGKPHRRHKFIGQRKLEGQEQEERHSGCPPGQNEFCSCTNQKDGWLCISCKDAQNSEVSTSKFTTCFGEDCEQLLHDARERRRICLWCDKPTSRSRAGLVSRLVFDQKGLEAQARGTNNLDLDQSVHYKLQKLSRRKLRGDDAVKDDPEADIAQFVGHLDTVNYRRYIHHRGPSGEQVYRSKHGSWAYDREFLLAIGKWCRQLSVPAGVRSATTCMAKLPARTNLEKEFITWNRWADHLAADRDEQESSMPDAPSLSEGQPTMPFDDQSHGEHVGCPANEQTLVNRSSLSLNDVGRLPDHLRQRDIQAAEGHMDVAAEEDVSGASNVWLGSYDVAAGTFADETEVLLARCLQEVDLGNAKRVGAKNTAQTEPEFVLVASCDDRGSSDTATIPQPPLPSGTVPEMPFRESLQLT